MNLVYILFFLISLLSSFSPTIEPMTAIKSIKPTPHYTEPDYPKPRLLKYFNPIEKLGNRHDIKQLITVLPGISLQR